MKKILFLLLSTIAMYGQVPADATPLENIQITNNTTDNSATKVNVQSTDGTINTISKSDLVNVVEVNDVPSLPLVGEVGKIYVVKNVNKIYRWNGTFYQELAVADISGKINVSEKGAINGVATLGSDGKVPNSQIPALAISETFPVSSQAQMLALSQADQGDVAIRSDISKSFILRVSPSSVLGNWSELLTSTSAVTSVNGQVGVVTLSKSDVGLSNVDNTSDANKPVSTAQQTALNLKENAFSKNTAFNKNFGTSAGTIAEGNDSRINNGQTAFGWGNHAGLYPSLTGTGATGTWGINITGSSYDSTLWNGYDISVAPTDVAPSGILSYYNSGVTFQRSSATALSSFLGLGSNAYTSTAYLPLSGGTLTGIVTAPTAPVGTNTTQIATTAFVQSNSRPYKVYTALLSQTGTNAPVATVLENTLGGTVVWSRVDTGMYLATLTGAFTGNKTVAFFQSGYSNPGAPTMYSSYKDSDNAVRLYSLSTGFYADQILSGQIEIRVYL